MWRGYLVIMTCVWCDLVYGNSSPRFNVTATSVQAAEDTPGGTSLYTIRAYDVDGGQLSLTYVYDPVDSEDMFTITETSSAGSIAAKVSLRSDKNFDYETLTSYTIYAYVFDGVAMSTINMTLKIIITDVNEAPYLNPPTTLQTFVTEEGQSGDTIGGPSFTVVDVDDNFHRWTITGGTGQQYISISESDGIIRLKAKYDRDDSSYPESVYVNVTISDDGGLTVDVTYFVTFLDKNDKLPVFDPVRYAFEYGNNSQIGDVVATLTYSDDDISSPNNVVTLALDQSNRLSQYFTLDGDDVKLQYRLDLEYGGGPYFFYILATDAGTPVQSATATLTFTIPGATTLPPTTTLIPPQADSGESTLSIGTNGLFTALLLIACFAAAVIVGYVLILSWRLHTYGKCLPKGCC